MKPAIKKPDADTITVPIQQSCRSQFRKQEEGKHKQSLSSSTEASVHPPWRYGAEMNSSSSAEVSVSQKSSTIRRSQLEQRERRVSALKTWPSTTTKPECNGAGQGQGEVLHFPVSVLTVGERHRDICIVCLPVRMFFFHLQCIFSPR